MTRWPASPPGGGRCGPSPAGSKERAPICTWARSAPCGRGASPSRAWPTLRPRQLNRGCSDRGCSDRGCSDRGCAEVAAARPLVAAARRVARRPAASTPAVSPRHSLPRHNPGGVATSTRPGRLRRGNSEETQSQLSAGPGRIADMNAAQHAPRGLARADGTAIRVLVVDDEPTLAEVLASVLRYEGWEVRTAADGSSAVRTAREFQPDAVVLDVMLPDFDGLEVLRRLRAASPHVCVLFLTARDAVEDRIAGITAGGDDYVTKPFSLEEVLARLRGLLRRSGVARSASDNQLVAGDLTMDEDAREVRRGGDLIELTATEFELLRYLMRNPRRVLSKAQILDRVWNYDFGGQAHVVELYISYLRKKIDAGRVPLIHTVRGVGYVLKPAG